MNPVPDSDSCLFDQGDPAVAQAFCIHGDQLWQWWQWARQTAIAYAIDPNEADWLVQAWTPLTRLELRLGSFRTVEAIAIAVDPAQLTGLWEQRLQQRVPVQYLAGKTTWREFSLRVTPAVLIPRPETELLIDLAQSICPNPEDAGHWADLGTGSGAIAIGLATIFPQATIHAVDVSPAALAIARTNAHTYHLGDRIQFYQGVWLDPLRYFHGNPHGTLSGIVSNPPYIPSDTVLTLQPEVMRHEPHLALDGGSDGLDCLRQLITQAPTYLQPHGLWLVELMAGQAPAIAQLLAADGRYEHIQIHTDLAGIERFVSAQRRVASET